MIGEERISRRRVLHGARPSQPEAFARLALRYIRSRTRVSAQISSQKYLAADVFMNAMPVETRNMKPMVT